MKFLRLTIILFSLLFNEKIKLYFLKILYTISGYINDKSTEQPLIGANIYIEGTSFKILISSTNEEGFYKITNVKYGIYTIKVTYIGYKTYSDTIKIYVGTSNNFWIKKFYKKYQTKLHHNRRKRSCCQLRPKVK